MTGPRILEIATELPPVQSGVAVAAGRVMDGLRGRGYSFDLLSAADAAHIEIGDYRLSALASRWFQLGKLVRGYDLVHLTGPAPCIADTFMARWRASRSALPPLVYTHGFTMVVDSAQNLSKLYRAAVAPTFAAADAVVVTTPSYAEIVREWYSGPVEIIGWAGDDSDVEASGSAYDGSRPLRVLFVGQQRGYKGIPDLVAATAGLGRVEVTIVGGGAEEERYRSLVAASGATNITHRGRLPDAEVNALFRSHDVVCLPSTNASEAFGIVLVEGMLRGCVPVASELPGVVDVVGRSGIVIPPRSPHALRAALDALARDPESVRSLRAQALEKASTYSWEATVDGYDRLYQRLLSERGPQAR